MWIWHYRTISRPGIAWAFARVGISTRASCNHKRMMPTPGAATRVNTRTETCIDKIDLPGSAHRRHQRRAKPKWLLTWFFLTSMLVCFFFTYACNSCLKSENVAPTKTRKETRRFETNLVSFSRGTESMRNSSSSYPFLVNNKEKEMKKGEIRK